MSKLSNLLDNMETPAWPDEFNADHRSLLDSIFAAAKQQARPYEGDYTAPFLLSEFEEKVWHTTNRGRERFVDGKWQGTVKVDWEIMMPDGYLLTHSKHQLLLHLNKRIAFLIRAGHVNCLVAAGNWRSIVYVLIQFTRWVILHDKVFHPDVYGFKLVNQAALDALMNSHAQGGWAEAHQVTQRLLVACYERSQGEKCPSEIVAQAYKLPEAVKQKLIRWFAANSYFGKVKVGANVGKEYLLRGKLAAIIGEPTSSIKTSARLSAFCRQFEPDLQNTALLISAIQLTEKPAQGTQKIADVIATGASEATLASVCVGLSTILASYRHVPDLLPEPSSISVPRSRSLAMRLTRQAGHHEFIPIPIGLAYFNQAMRFVHVYGDAIINFYLAVVSLPSADERISLYSNSDEHCVGAFAEQFTISTPEGEVPIGKVLGIAQFRRIGSSLDFELLRKAPTLDEALRVLIGACIICIAIMKPSREHELTHLKRDCLFHDGYGYYLRFSSGKSNTGEAYLDKDRPIPVISARAIQLLQKLGSGLVEISDKSSTLEDNLFYLPRIRYEGVMVADAGLLNPHLDKFCDYVGLEADEEGRRWYVRTHQMRKWFLLLLFWSGRFDVLDAARWMASHSNASHIYAYIEKEFPGEELPKLEAEYAVTRLRNLVSAGERASSNDAGLDLLYDAVLDHFKVQSLSLVPDVEWEDYVVSLRLEDGFHLEPHSVYAQDEEGEVVGLNVSFVLREKES